MTKIKICGITRTEDAIFCDSLGVDFLGFIFVEKSPRFIGNPDKFRNLRTKAKKVAVFMNQKIEFQKLNNFEFIQLHGFEGKEIITEAKSKGFGIIKTIFPELNESVKLCERIADLVDYFLVDSSSKLASKSGKFDEKSLNGILNNGKIFGKSFFLSGGINTENVSFYIERIRPFGIDVSSGVEESPGVKSHTEVEKFVKTVRSKTIQ